MLNESEFKKLLESPLQAHHKGEVKVSNGCEARLSFEFEFLSKDKLKVRILINGIPDGDWEQHHKETFPYGDFLWLIREVCGDQIEKLL